MFFQKKDLDKVVCCGTREWQHSGDAGSTVLSGLCVVGSPACVRVCSFTFQTHPGPSQQFQTISHFFFSSKTFCELVVL